MFMHDSISKHFFRLQGSCVDLRDQAKLIKSKKEWNSVDGLALQQEIRDTCDKYDELEKDFLVSCLALHIPFFSSDSVENARAYPA